MFISQLFEAEAKNLVVVYPGRFQPFHRGHAGVFAQLQAKYGRGNVYVGTAPNASPDARSPFTFTDKYQLITAAGVPGNNIVETANPYSIDTYKTAIGFDPKTTVFIVAVGEPDRGRLNPDSVLKRDQKDKTTGLVTKPAGSPGYYKTFQSFAECETADRHGYVIIIPEVKSSITINGKTVDASHGTECRAIWNSIRGNNRARAEFLTQLYGRATPELAHIFDKIPAPATPQEEPVKEDRFDTKAGTFIKRAQLMHPYAKSDAEALALYSMDKEQSDVDHVEDEEHSLEQKVERLEQELAKLKQDLHGKVTEAGGTGVVASKKQANDPRYSMSLTKDVRPGQINKSLRAFDLAEVDSMSSTITGLQQQQIARLKDDVEYWEMEANRATDPELRASYLKKIAVLKQRIADTERLR